MSAGRYDSEPMDARGVELEDAGGLYTLKSDGSTVRRTPFAEDEGRGVSDIEIDFFCV